MTFRLTTTAFQVGGVIPKKFTCDGPDLSPTLTWTDPPAETQGFALIMDDPDAPAGTWVHWLLYDLPSGTRGLPEGIAKDRRLPDGSHQGRNDFGKIGYNGPCPPRGAVHRYYFRLYALNRRTDLGPGASRSELEHAMKDHILAQTELVGRFQH